MNRENLIEQLNVSASVFSELLNSLKIDDKDWFEGMDLERILDAATANPSAAPDPVQGDARGNEPGVDDVTGMVVSRGIHAVQNDGLAILNAVDRMFELSGDQLEEAVSEHVLEGRNYLIQRALMGFGRGSQKAQKIIEIEELPLPKFNSPSRLTLPSVDELNKELDLLPAASV